MSEGEGFFGRRQSTSLPRMSATHPLGVNATACATGAGKFARRSSQRYWAAWGSREKPAEPRPRRIPVKGTGIVFVQSV